MLVDVRTAGEPGRAALVPLDVEAAEREAGRELRRAVVDLGLDLLEEGLVGCCGWVEQDGR